jgi:DNA-binding protein Alba
MERPTNVIHVREGSARSYAMAAELVLKESGSVTMRAVGRAINVLVDAEEIIKREVPGAALEKVEIGTTEVETLNGRRIKRSFMELVISVKPP